MEIDPMEIASIVSSFVSLILAVIAIWQAIHFYTEGKNTEARVETTLAAIKAQVDTLQSLNGRTMDRLTKYATTHREDGSSQVANAVSSALRELPSIILQLKIPAQDSNQSVMRKEIVGLYILLRHYIATTNINASFCLPRVDEFDESNKYHVYVKDSADKSFADFKYMSDIIRNLPPDEINASLYLNLHREVEQNYIHLVGDTAQHFSRQAKTYANQA